MNLKLIVTQDHVKKNKVHAVFLDNSYLHLFQFFIHSDLGKIIQFIVKEFKKHPPQFLAVR